MRVTSALLAASLLVVMLLATPATALDPQRGLGGYKHSRWTAIEGAPPIIYALEQDRNGYLLIGSAAGLYRFDGLTFEHIKARDPEIDQGRLLFMVKARDGVIWLAYDTGHIATYRDGVLQRDRSAPLIPLEPSGILQARDGAIWVSLDKEPTLLRHQNGNWERVTPDLAPADLSGTVSLFASRDGTLWLQTYHSLYVLKEAEKHFERFAAISGRTVLSEDKTGRIWASDDRGTRPLLLAPSRGGNFPTPPFNRWTAVTRFDRDGNLWITNGQGLFRLQTPDVRGLGASESGESRVEGLTSKDGLTADTTTPLFEDREGNIWIGTTRGLDQFRDASIVNEPALIGGTGRSLGLLAGSDGTVYVGTADALYRIPPGGRPALLARPLKEPRLICEAADGDIWAMGADAFVRVRGSVVQRTPVPGPFRKLGPYELGGCVTDDHGVLWVSRYQVGNPDSGLFTLSGGEWSHAQRPPRAWPKGLDRTSTGQLAAWLRSGDVGLMDVRGNVTSPLVRMPLSTNHMIQATSEGIVLGGDFGLARIKNGKLQTVERHRFPWLADITGLAETPEGQTWIMGRSGIVGLSTGALDRAFGDPRAPLNATILDFQDGLPEVRSLVNQHGAVRGGDGRIWFATVNSVVWVDPARLVHNSLPPLVHIRGVTAGSTPYSDPSKALELARGTTSVAIRYAGLSLTVPQRVRFRYQLEGVDDKWVDPGARREAFYTNLGAGTYRFRVIAANDDGVWNREGATLQFTIPPTFLQSIWFKLLCAVALGLFVWGVVRVRTKAVRASLQARFDGRMAERERIARELHDTLLQSVQGLILVVQSTVEGLPSDNTLRKSVEEALDRADTVLGEGRDQVQALRSDAPPQDMSEALEKAAATIIPGAVPQFRLLVDGAPRVLRPAVSREVVRIAEEALRNAARHALATTITLTLNYRPQGLQVSVRDNGSGMAKEIVNTGRRQGHYGLVGMRERAEQIAGRLEIISGPGAGTEVRLTIPASVGYRDDKARLRNRIRSLWRGEKF
jgi:signal transduction histidine kinase/ligand-binding sensor domain-containing protein